MRRPHILHIPRRARHSCRRRQSPSYHSCKPWCPCSRKPRRSPPHHRHPCRWLWMHRQHILRIPRRARHSCHRPRSPSCRNCKPSRLCSQTSRRNLQLRHRRCQSQSTRRPHTPCNPEQRSHRNHLRRSQQGCSCRPTPPCSRQLRRNHTHRRHPHLEHRFHRSRMNCLGNSQGIRNFHRQAWLSRRSCMRCTRQQHSMNRLCNRNKRQGRRSRRRWWRRHCSCTPRRRCIRRKRGTHMNRRQTKPCRRSCRPRCQSSRSTTQNRIGLHPDKWHPHRSCTPNRSDSQSSFRNRKSRCWCWQPNHSCTPRGQCILPQAARSCLHPLWHPDCNSAQIRPCSPKLRPPRTPRPCRCPRMFRRS